MSKYKDQIDKEIRRIIAIKNQARNWKQENKRLREALETFRPMMILLENMPSCTLTSKERKMYALMQAALEVITP